VVVVDADLVEKVEGAPVVVVARLRLRLSLSLSREVVVDATELDVTAVLTDAVK
jgi:hypothetical protein